MKAIPKLLFHPDHLPLVVQDPKLAPQAAKKKEKKFGQAKAAGKGLKGFVD